MDVPADALFLEYQQETGGAITVEVFPRANGHTLITAFSDEPPLPIDPAAVTPDQSEVDRLQIIGERLSPALRPEKIIARQACFRPITQDGLPLIGKVPQIEGAYVATGHSVWGILNAPATGEALAELIADGGARSTDLRPFDPARLRPLTRRCCARVSLGVTWATDMCSVEEPSNLSDELSCATKCLAQRPPWHAEDIYSVHGTAWPGRGDIHQQRLSSAAMA